MTATAEAGAGSGVGATGAEQELEPDFGGGTRHWRRSATGGWRTGGKERDRR